VRKQSASKPEPPRDPLENYRDKRDPARTTEPFEATAEQVSSAATTLHGAFVVHLHDATRRHYDVRLQVGRTLKSFAVPRGPSLDPADKRLAVHTEDHPLSYLDFEDVIPDGNYGAGPMIVWDAGRVVYLDGTAEDGLARGKLDFQLSGHKLRGRFALVHTGARRKAGSAEARQWLLIKKGDAHATVGRDLERELPRSVLSGLTVEELGRADAIAAELEAEAARLGAPEGDVDARALVPMLCATDGARLDDPGRYYELKLDGVRIVADRRGDDVELRYRRQRVATASYPEVARAVRSLAPRRLVLDGEIVAFDERGKPSFHLLARRFTVTRAHDVRRVASEVPVSYLVFDVLAIGRRDLTPLPLRVRKALLERLLPGKGLLRRLDHIEGDGRALHRFCEEQALEGVVAKRADAPYRAGPARTGDWVKIKCRRESDLVVVGWEEGRGAGGVGALVLASYDEDGALVLRGKVGSGLSEAVVAQLMPALRAAERSDAPALRRAEEEERTGSRATGPRHWTEPALVVSVEHNGWTEGGHLWQPTYRGLRADLTPRECTATPGDELVERAARGAAAGAGAVGRVRAADVAVRTELSNQDKLFWPGEGHTKGDLCDYYASVAEVLLPLLRNRPIVLVRYPDGITGKSFYQWNVPRGTPDWLRTLQLREEGERGKSARHCFLIDDIDGLLHIANLGCIPIHILAAREGSRESCDFFTIDFDIGAEPFKHAVVLALALREILEELGLVGFPKTSGQKGLHVLVPLGPGVPFEAAKMLSELCGRLLCLRHRDVATMERRVEARGPKIYVDTGQTGRSRTIVAPYSVRAVAGAGVSTPLTWDELHVGLDAGAFTMATVPERIAEIGDPMRELLAVRPDIAGALAKLEKRIRPAP
jgi:bifunctional non-homologous end joining protein LigD